MERNQMTFYLSYLEAVEDIEGKDAQLEYLLAILNLGLRGVETEFRYKRAKAPFANARRNILNGISRSENRLNKKIKQSESRNNTQDFVIATGNNKIDINCDKQEEQNQYLTSIREGEREGERERERLIVYSCGANAPNNQPTSKTKFSAPTIDEVRSYCYERNNSVDPEKFVDYYTANGWRVGKNPMKDWRAAVRNWEHGKSSENHEEKSLERSYDRDAFFEAAVKNSLEKHGKGGENDVHAT